MLNKKHIHLPRVSQKIKESKWTTQSEFIETVWSFNGNINKSQENYDLVVYKRFIINYKLHY